MKQENKAKSQPNGLHYSGERIIPGEVPEDLELRHRRRYEFARKYVEGRRALDVGCGEGYGSAILAEKAAHVVSIDISEEAVAHASAAYPMKNVEFQCMPAEQIPFSDNSFDVIVCFELIEHTRDHIAVMNAMRRVLRPGGILILSTPNKRIVSPGSPTPLNKYHLREFSVAETRRLCHSFFADVEFFTQENPFGKSRRLIRRAMALDFGYLRRLLPRSLREALKWKVRGKLRETIEDRPEAGRWAVVPGIDRDSHPIIAVCRKPK